LIIKNIKVWSKNW